MTCANCKALEARIAELEADLEGAIYSTSDRAVLLATRLGISRQQARIVDALYRRGAACTPSLALIEMLENDRGSDYPGGTANLVSVLVYNIRARLGRGFLKSQHGSGYWLPDAARAQVAEALR